jgi:hypothetical protein
MALGIPHIDAAHQNGSSTGMEHDRRASDDPGIRSTRDDRRGRIYNGLGGLPRFSPSKTLGAAIVFLAIAIALIIAFVR